MQCFRNFPVAKNFMDKGGYQVFPSKLFSLTVPKNFAGESFTVYYFQVSKYVRDKRRGEHQDFPPKNFRLMVPNISYCNPFVQCFRISQERRTLWIVGGGVSRLSVENFSSHITENFRTATILSSVSEILR